MLSNFWERDDVSNKHSKINVWKNRCSQVGTGLELFKEVLEWCK